MSDDSDIIPAHNDILVPEEEENNGNEALIYHNRVLVISSSSNLLIYIIIFITAIVPWWITRNESLKTIHYFISERISTSSKAFANATENLMRKYEITGTQLKDLSYDPLLAKCSSDGILNYIRYAQTMNSIINPKISRFYLSHNQTASCQLELDQLDSNKFQIYILFPFNQTHDQLKVFTEETNFNPDYFNFEDSNSGKLLRFIPFDESTIKFSNNPDFYEVPYWTNAIPFYGNLTENRTLTFIYPHKNKTEPDSTTLSGVAVSSEEIYNILNNIPSSIQISWIILDGNYNILIDKELGAIHPNNTVMNIPQFPNVRNSRNKLWNEASEYLYNLKNETPILITLSSEIQYYLVKREISTYNGRLTFNIFMMISFDEISSEVFRPANYLLLIVILLIGTAIFLEWFFDQQTKKRRDKKLSLVYREKNLNESSEFNTDNSIFDNIEGYSKTTDPSMKPKPPFFNKGAIGRSIFDLRKIELYYPEETMMNKIVSSSVNCFAKTRNRLFSITSASENCRDCEFCKYLNPESFKITNWNTEEQFIPSQKQHLSFLLFQQRSQRVRLSHNSKDLNDNIFHPYMFMNLKSDQIISQDLLDENYQEDSETINSSNIEVSNHKLNANSYYSNRDENPYLTWEILSFNNINHSYYEQSDINNPIKIRKKIIFKLIELIHNKKLIFIDIDPDQIIEFALFFSETFIKNPYQTYDRLKTIEYLLNMDFQAWINNKLDIFTLILCTFACDIETITDEEEIMFLSNEKKKIKKETDLIDINSENDSNNDNNNSQNNSNSHENDNANSNSHNNDNANSNSHNNDNANSNSHNNDNANNDSHNNDNPNNNSHANDRSTKNKLHFNILEMPIFDISTDSIRNNFPDITESYSSNDNYSNEKIDKSKNHVITESDIFKQINEKENSSNNDNEQSTHYIFTLNDQYSKKMRKIQILKYCFEKFIPFDNHSFNHTYISQRIDRIFESCDTSNHFEIFSEFENRSLSSEFSVINNSEDINIFLNAIFSFTKYSHYWCEIDDFDNIFEEFNHQNFTKQELKNDKFVWNFHDLILSRVVKPFFQLLSIFCPLEEMEEKIVNISRLIQMKIEGKPIIYPTTLFKNISDNNSSYSASYNTDSNRSSRSTDNSDNQSSRSRKRLSLNKGTRIKFKISNNNINDDDDDLYIDDGNGDDVDGD